MGRTKLPDNVKMMRGTDQPCRMNGDESFSLAQSYEIPAYLDPSAKKIYTSMAERLIAQRLLTIMDFEQLSAYAINYARCIKAEKMIKKEGEVILIKDEDGNYLRQERNVWLKIQDDCIKAMNTIGTQFGFTPLSRVKLAALLKTDNKNTDDFSDFEEL